MLRSRVIPCLLLHDGALVKTQRFGKFDYIGEPLNTVRIFNELEVDEIVVLDILASRRGLAPDYRLISEMASECFMPLSYGGGIATIDQAKRIFASGVEKVIVNSGFIQRPGLVTEIAKHSGSQSVIVSIDVRRGFGKTPVVASAHGLPCKISDPVEAAKHAVQLGAGELLLTSMDRDGTWEGYDLALVKSVADAVDVPIIASGGAGNVQDIKSLICSAGASAAAVGSMVVYQKKGFGVLVHFPDRAKLDAELLSGQHGR
ncbi:MAG: imidazole glycerol phosphate synthase subunit HisF [Alphaproteobacteria bacterium]|nr:imidazole glycerol phosphate synthase subunit HisF [Alphaproteobacteria bacterium]